MASLFSSKRGGVSISKASPPLLSPTAPKAQLPSELVQEGEGCLCPPLVTGSEPGPQEQSSSGCPSTRAYLLWWPLPLWELSPGSSWNLLL
jgi:hypothetical protein